MARLRDFVGTEYFKLIEIYRVIQEGIDGQGISYYYESFEVASSIYNTVPTKVLAIQSRSGITFAINETESCSIIFDDPIKAIQRTEERLAELRKKFINL